MRMSDFYHKKLTHYSKEDIIQVLCHAPFVLENVPKRMLEYLEQEEWRRLNSECKKVRDSEEKAMTAYLEWAKAMSEKYGDGEKFSLHLLSEQEHKYGMSLLKACEETRKRRRTITKKIDKHLKMTGATA